MIISTHNAHDEIRVEVSVFIHRMQTRYIVHNSEYSIHRIVHNQLIGVMISN